MSLLGLLQPAEVLTFPTPLIVSKRPVSEKAEIYFSLLGAVTVVAVLFDFIRDEMKERANGVDVRPFGAPSIKDFEVVL